VNRLTLTINL